ncbi:MAG: hypothetical protein QNJ45_12270 [Ardenticatenaceae bacterium]|nr:hypothetical protein [Ardenticatenaceae bacterium]
MRNKEKPKKKRNLFKRLAQIALLALAAIVIFPLLGAVVQCRMWDPKEAADFPVVELLPETADLPDYARNEEQTYLTLPEWYIVFNADEYGAFLADNRPSRFSYGQAIRQFWSTYYTVCRQTRDDYPFNGEYQIILGVIGVSFTVETAVRGGYEKTLGRIFETIGGPEPTEEEVYAQQVAVEYGEFIHTIPWFKFPFWEKLEGLWNETDLWGPRPVRKWERKLVLTTEYAIKAGYGALLDSGRDNVLSEINFETQMWVLNFDENIIAGETDVSLVKPLADDAAIITMPRYEPVTQIVPRLAAAGLTFKEIAGNDDILITLLVPEGYNYSQPGEVLQSLTYLSDPQQKRLVVTVPVVDLHTVLLSLNEDQVVLEHIFDY